MLIFVQTTIAAREAAKDPAANQKTEFGEGRVFSRNLVAILEGHTDRPWSELRRGKALTELWFAKELRPFGIKPRTIWIGNNSAKG